MSYNFNSKIKDQKDEKKKKDVKTIINSSSSTSISPQLKSFYNTAKIREDYDRVMESYRENLRKLERLSKLHGTEHLTDNKNSKITSSNGTKSARGKYDLNELQVAQRERENKRLCEKISKAKSVLPTCEQLKKDWNEHLRIVKLRSKTPRSVITVSKSNISQKEYECSRLSENRPLIFLDLAIKDGKNLGRMTAVLFIDIVPKTVLHFIQLCENDIKAGSYKGQKFRRIFSDLYAEVTEIKNRNRCDDDGDFMPENFIVDHNEAGTLAMFPMPSGKVNSAFTISFRPLETLNGRRVAFGRIVNGQKILETIETFGIEYGKPKRDIIITNCGLLNRE